MNIYLDMFAFIKNAITTHKALVQIQKKNPLCKVSKKLITALHILNSKPPSSTNCYSDSKSVCLSYIRPFDPNM